MRYEQAIICQAPGGNGTYVRPYRLLEEEEDDEEEEEEELLLRERFFLCFLWLERLRSRDLDRSRLRLRSRPPRPREEPPPPRRDAAFAASLRFLSAISHAQGPATRSLFGLTLSVFDV